MNETKETRKLSLDFLDRFFHETYNKVLDALRVYDECHVEFYNGDVNVCIGYCISYRKSQFFSRFYANEVFTEEERIVNYIESFRSYPHNYKGKRDYQWLKSLPSDAKLKLDTDGNIILA
jgi:hypothetical protein